MNKKEETINETIQILEDLILAIKDGNLNRFDDLTYDTEGAYCSGQGLAVIADLEGTRNILEQRKQLKEGKLWMKLKT